MDGIPENMLFRVTRKCGKIPLGKRGEHWARIILFDISDFSMYGDGDVRLLVTRPGDTAPYEAKFAIQEGTEFVWLVSEIDTAMCGNGSCELQYLTNNTLAKSTLYPTQVLPSIGEPGDAPDAPVSWATVFASLETACDLAADAAEIAGQASETAAQAAEIAAQASENTAAAAGAANEAAGSASSAQKSTEEAASSAYDAQEAAAVAQTSAAAAEDSARQAKECAQSMAGTFDFTGYLRYQIVDAAPETYDDGVLYIVTTA